MSSQPSTNSVISTKKPKKSLNSKPFPQKQIDLRLACLLVGIFAFLSTVRAQSNPLIDILSKELDREFEVLSKADDPVYYMDYQVMDVNQQIIHTNLGSLVNSTHSRRRTANVNIRIGDYQRDNTHNVNEFNQQQFNAMPIALETNEQAISHMFWTMTNIKYQAAVEEYRQATAREDKTTTADFTKEKPEVYIEEIEEKDLTRDTDEIEARLKRLSALFLQNENIIIGEVSLNREVKTKYFVSTEGSKVAHQIEYNFLSISGNILDSEGAFIPLYQTYFAYDLDELPDEESLKADINRLIETLVALQSAPLAEPYSGPAILHPRAAGVFFHEIFGHRIEGSRLSSEYDSQTFKEKVGESVLPKSISVYMDPTIKELGDQALLGHYLFDDEGVRAQKVNVVEGGILKNFLMTRKPLDSFVSSNGHARTEGGMAPVSRQSNLIVEADRQLSEDDLRKQLIKECKKQGKKYGYYFVDVEGGFTNTNRFSPNAFNIMPTVVYKVYVDGRPDELVRGVDLIGTPLSMFAEIKAASDHRATFNGYCGAESGNVPVSATAPGLLVRRIETQKKMRETNEDEAPILSRPLSGKAND
uniref:TldD/PmbA family protein n=1 Tax=Ekhidna sp. TaxID=2608089 RepID=UPI0032EBA59C